MEGRRLVRLEQIARHLSPEQPSDACGIIAVVGGSTPAVDYLVEGLTILQNRGYDSAGIVTVKPGSKELRVSKFASGVTSSSTSDALQLLTNAASAHKHDLNVGIGHTRWATHGAKTDQNAHPHLDATGRIAVVHNGVIENSEELKPGLERDGFPCKSETDTEVIAQLLGRLVVKDGHPVMEAVELAQKLLKGSWGLAVLDREHPEFLVAAAHGSPLLIGLAGDKKFVASEASAFAKYTRQYVSVKDREVIKISTAAEMDVERHETYANTEEVALSPAPYPHWTLKEIHEQPASIMRALNFGGRVMDGAHVKLGGLEEHKDALLAIDHLVVAACGTSMHAGMLGARLMRLLRAFKTVTVVDAAELEASDLPHSARGGLLVISQSGETKDVMRCLKLALERDLVVFSVVNAVGSTIARTARCGVYLNAGRETAVASTKAFTSQATVLSLIAIWFAQNRGEHGLEQYTREALVSSLHGLSMAVQSAISNSLEACRRVARHLYDGKHQKMFILGKGPGHSIALEAALKIKEIAYVQAEGYAGGALKHGPFALIEDGTPILLVVLNDAHKKHMMTAAAEVHARGAHVIAITDQPSLVGASKHIDQTVPIPTLGLLTGVVAAVPFQLIAYELALLYGHSIDTPRHLAKAVTV